MMQRMNKLVKAAIDARKNAYAPYSKFFVGAAVLTKDGSIFSGCNIENSSFGATVCAERVAIFKAISEGAGDIEAIALVTDTSKPSTPCGICLQVIAEANPKMTVYLANMKGKVKKTTIKKLLPSQFSL